MDYKQVIVIRADLKMSKGKTAAQAAHASVEAMQNCEKRLVTAWHSEGMKKVVLQANGEKDLISLRNKARAEKLATALIKDAGMTEVEPGTITALGIGPDKDSKIDKVTGRLKVL